jgi:hypothetical protein
MMSLAIQLLIGFIFLVWLRSAIINKYKIAYYEQKLRNRNVDISAVKNIGVFDILYGK